MEWSGGPMAARALPCPLTQGADPRDKSKYHVCDLRETADCQYVCVISGLVHRCGTKCNRKIEGSEGIVCSLTGRCLGAQLVLHRPFNREGRSQSHYVIRPKTLGKRRGPAGVDISSNKTSSQIHKALQELLFSTKRTQLHAFYHNRFIAEAVKMARKQSGSLLAISRAIKKVTQTHIMHLLPQAEHKRTVDSLCQRVHAFLMRLNLDMPNTKAVQTFAAVCFDLLSGASDFIVCGRVYVRASRWCRTHGVTMLMYPELGFGSRSMTACTRQIRKAVTAEGQPLPIEALEFTA